MQPLEAVPATPRHIGRFHPVLRSAADEFCSTLAHLIAYACALALLFIFGIYLWDQRPDVHSVEPTAESDWRMATRSMPAFASSQYDFSYTTRSYQILRHPEGGRKDILRWGAENGRPIAELEIYRLGSEFEPGMTGEPHAAGLVDSKFGPAALLRLPDDEGCLGFLKTIDQPALRISGFVCQGETVPARGAAIACMLNRLSLITAGNDAKLAELFARTALKRAECRTDWVSGSHKPALRGAI
jgi:hypothetical protein